MSQVGRDSGGQAETGRRADAGRAKTGTDAPRTLTVLGATGSIGDSTLDLVARNPDRFDIVALTAHSNAGKLADLAIRHRAKVAVIGDPAQFQELKARLQGSGVTPMAGAEALEEAGSMPADCVMAAIVGAAGLPPTFRAASQGRRVALANKECLVSAGDVFMDEVKRAGTELLPVDSEHSAAFQAIGANPAKAIEKITLTASGGPFRTWPLERLKAAMPEAALKHPNWSMGAKITIDSATLMNKGLELIEAYHLFPVGVDQLGAIVHPQSIVHCLVSYLDGSVLAQLSNPDMRTPISLSLAWPARMAAPTPALDLIALKTLTFEAVDETRFPAFRVAREALARGGAAPAVLNAANEVAVAAFLERRIGFMDIARLADETIEAAAKAGYLAQPGTLEAVIEVDCAARALATGRLKHYVCP